MVGLPGTLSHWGWLVLLSPQALGSRPLLERRGLCVAVKVEGLGWPGHPLCESLPLIYHPSCLSLPLCTPVAQPVKREQRLESNDEKPKEVAFLVSLFAAKHVYSYLMARPAQKSIGLQQVETKFKCCKGNQGEALPWEKHFSLE